MVPLGGKPDVWSLGISAICHLYSFSRRKCPPSAPGTLLPAADCRNQKHSDYHDLAESFWRNKIIPDQKKYPREFISEVLVKPGMLQHWKNDLLRSAKGSGRLAYMTEQATKYLFKHVLVHDYRRRHTARQMFDYFSRCSSFASLSEEAARRSGGRECAVDPMGGGLPMQPQRGRRGSISGAIGGRS